jgi:hypothetical protein
MPPSLVFPTDPSVVIPAYRRQNFLHPHTIAAYTVSNLGELYLWQPEANVSQDLNRRWAGPRYSRYFRTSAWVLELLVIVTTPGPKFIAEAQKEPKMQGAAPTVGSLQ